MPLILQKDPGKSIGKGTLLAVLTSFLIYTLLVFQFASAFPYETLRENTTVLQVWWMLGSGLLFALGCKRVVQDACYSEYIVVAGLIISTASSALGAMFGGSRLLQAIAADDLFPGRGVSRCSL